LEGKTE